MKTITADDRNFIITFDFERELVSAVKTLPMARFEGKTKSWSVPLIYRDQIKKFTADYFFNLTDEACDRLTSPAIKATLVQIPDLDSPLPNGQTLFGHQKFGIRFLIDKVRAILADDMGLGKTRQALIAAKAFGIRIVVVAPVSLQENWRREAMMVNAKIEVFSWDKMPQFFSEPFVFIPDEAHYAQSGSRSQRGKKFLEIALDQNCQAVFCLTGTPLKNGKPINLMPLLQAVRHPIVGNVGHYQKRYCDAKATRFCRWDVSGATNLKELHQLIGDTMLRRTKKECLDLPSKLRVYREVEWSDEDRKSYDAKFKQLQSEYRERVRKGLVSEESEALVTVGHLRQAASVAKIRTAVEIAQELLEQGQPVVIFTAFKDSARYIKQQFEDNAVLLTGEVLPEKRQPLVDAFQDGVVNVFVATVGAGGVGITLTRSHNVILVDRPWTPGDTDQAEDRLNRIGQNNQVTSIWLQANDIDKAVDSIIEAKEDTIELVLNGKRKRIARTSTQRQISQVIAEMVF